MAHLSICLFGSFEVTLGGEPVTGFASDKVRALLAYLAVESDRPHRREALAGLLWPEYPEPSARASLRRALANLRTVIGDRQASPPFLSISRQTVQFNCVDDTWCDVTAFTHALEAAQSSPQAIHRLEEAAELYRRSFLEGFSLGDSVAFEEWLLLKRERLRREALAALINADGSNLTQLTDGDPFENIPVWSPDGEWIAFNRNGELWLIRPDGSEPHRLFGESGKFCVGELNWSPNSQQIAFIGDECAPAPGIPVLPRHEVWVINRDGTASRVVHTFERQPDYAGVFWDQDSLKIVCEHTYGGEEPRLLHIDADGIGEPYLIRVLPFEWHPNFWPQWGKIE